ncbi:hypothetical protein HOP40_17800 [Pseudonocardia broussonetiae]|uniref:Uncharacterized protein n=1 Tax=Pseudonocardia broussonetiae TaxID=2736640 RepID=A0A6M6JTF3_9PSEU|nr:hypothetical protein HOP40_17800 [Pseudonocardia broussonetiae]
MRMTWAELQALVGELPASAEKHRAWWGGDRSHVRAWRNAGFTVGGLDPGREVTFVPAPGVPPRTTPVELRDEAALQDEPRPADVLLVGCVKTKSASPCAAKDLYVSPLFLSERRYAEARGLPWFILSAEYGLVAPDEWISPYERYLPDTPASYRAAWAAWVAARLEMIVGPLSGTTIEVHAGETYLQAVSPPLNARSAVVTAPLAGLGLGKRMGWYAAQPSGLNAVREDSAPPPDAAPEAVDSMVATLLDDTAAMTAATFLGSRRDVLNAPGLYSWWVDATGAADLSAGLGLTVRPGLIYAGLAGATRWPSGKRSTNTLWSRIAGMHLGGRHEFSTFRRTLGSVLASAHGAVTIDEEALTRWMNQHLAVRVAVVPDADALGRLERDVLGVIDPPLNLKGMTGTPVRSRLTELRHIYGRT